MTTTQVPMTAARTAAEELAPVYEVRPCPPEVAAQLDAALVKLQTALTAREAARAR